MLGPIMMTPVAPTGTGQLYHGENAYRSTTRGLGHRQRQRIGARQCMRGSNGQVNETLSDGARWSVAHATASCASARAVAASASSARFRWISVSVVSVLSSSTECAPPDCPPAPLALMMAQGRGCHSRLSPRGCEALPSRHRATTEPPRVLWHAAGQDRSSARRAGFAPASGPKSARAA
jgi:hypothetical protein